MKRFCFIMGVVLVVFLNIKPSSGDQAVKPSSVKVGLGLSTGAELDLKREGFEWTPFGLPNLYIPIRINDRFKIEPELGYVRTSNFPWEAKPKSVFCRWVPTATWLRTATTCS